MRITINVIRPWGSKDVNALNMSDAELSKNSLYLEYREIWEKDDGDELSVTKRLVSRLDTGRQLRFIDHLPAETIEEFDLNEAPPGIVHLMKIDDFSVLRFRLRGI